MFDPVIAPSGTLLGLLQRGRGDGTLHALTAPRAEALAALNHCVLRDPRHDWQVENRSLYYARLYLDLDGELDEIERHLFDPEDLLDTDESRTGLALAVLGHLASYGRRDALRTAAPVRRHRRQLGLGPGRAGPARRRRGTARPRRARPRPVPGRPGGRGRARRRRARRLRAPALAAVGRRSARSGRRAGAGPPGTGLASTAGSGRCAPPGPAPAGACRPSSTGPSRASTAAARASRAGRPLPHRRRRPRGPARDLEAARSGRDGARCRALRYLADGRDPDALDLIEAAAVSPSTHRRRGRRRRLRTDVRRRRRGPGAALGPSGPTRSAPPPPVCSPAGAAPRTPTSSSPLCATPYAAKAPTPTPVDPRRRRRPAGHRLRRTRTAPRLPGDGLLPSARPGRPRARRHRPLLRRRLRRRMPVGLRGDHPRGRRTPRRDR